MKKLVLSTLLGLAAVISSPVQALTATGAFDVTVNLYPKCEFVTPPTALNLHYVSFQATASTNTVPFTLRCTSNVVYALSLAGSAGAGGTLSGLNYTLATMDSAGTAAASSGTGSGGNQIYTVKGTIAGGLGGDCTPTVSNSGTAGTQVAATTGANTGAAVGAACTGTSASGAHVLTITY